MRCFLDRVMGYRVSPLLGGRLGAGLSAGGMQSPALRLVVDREREIRAFEPRACWEIVVAARSSAGEFAEFEVVDADASAAAVRESGDRALHFGEEEVASRVAEQVREAAWWCVPCGRPEESRKESNPALADQPGCAAAIGFSAAPPTELRPHEDAVSGLQPYPTWLLWLPRWLGRETRLGWPGVPLGSVVRWCRGEVHGPEGRLTAPGGTRDTRLRDPCDPGDAGLALRAVASDSDAVDDAADCDRSRLVASHHRDVPG